MSVRIWKLKIHAQEIKLFDLIKDDMEFSPILGLLDSPYMA